MPFPSESGVTSRYTRRNIPQPHVVGSLSARMSPPREYLFTTNTAVDHSQSSVSEKRMRTLHDRAVTHQRQQSALLAAEAEKEAGVLILKKKEQGEDRLRQLHWTKVVQHEHSDPMNVIASLRDRVRQKPHLLTHLFPPGSTESMGLLTITDIDRGLRTMGFELPSKKLQMVLTILGLSSALSNNGSIPLIRLRASILNSNLEQHFDEHQWKGSGGGQLALQYKERAKTNRGDPALEKLRELEEQKFAEEQRIANESNVVMDITANCRQLLSKITDRFSTVRRAFRTMDKDRSGSLTRIELKNVLDTFCMQVTADEFDELMNYFDADHDGLISYEEFLHVVSNEIQPQMRDKNLVPDDASPTKPVHNPRSSRHVRKQYTTEHREKYTQPTYIPLKTLDELKIYTDFLKKIATEFGGIQEAFMAIDIHREGFITPDELKAVLDTFAFRMTQVQFTALLGVFDQNHDGKISYDEFLSQVKFMDDTELEAMRKEEEAEMLEFDNTPEAKKRLQQLKNRTSKKTSYEFLMEKIWEKSDSIHSAFKLMDLDRSGSLSANELKAVLDSYCYKVPDEIFANMLALFDADGDGEISFHEFMACVKRSVGTSGYNQENTHNNPAPAAPTNNGGGGAGYMESAKANVAAKAKKTKVVTVLKNLLEKISEKHRTINKAFRFIDKDGSGSLSHDELKSVLESSGYKIDNETFGGVLEIFDADGSGSIEYNEFLEHAKTIMQSGETDAGMGVQLSMKESLNRGRGGPAIQLGDEGKAGTGNTKVVGAALRYLCEKIHEKWADIRKSFMMLDWNKSGTISPTELRAVIDDCCYTVSDEVFNEMVDAFDEDGDGEISYNELLDTLKRVINGDEIHHKNAVKKTGPKWQVSERKQSVRTRRPSLDGSMYGQPGLHTDQEHPHSPTKGRFAQTPREVPNLGLGHLHICKSIDNKYAVINDAMKRLDYDKKFFISVQELKAAVETYCGRLNPVLWDDLICFFDPAVTGVVDYEKFLGQVRDQANYDQYASGNSAYGGLRGGFGVTAADSKVVSHISMQNGAAVENKGSALGMGAHGSSDVNASMKFLCEKIYEKFSNIRTAFMKLDQDRGGTIGRRELKNILDDCCYTVPEDTFEECYKLFDTNNDGDISYNEFMNQVKRIVEPGDGGSPMEAVVGKGETTSLSNQLINKNEKLAKQKFGQHSVKELYSKHSVGGSGNVAGGHDAGTGLKFLQDKLRTQTESVRTAFRILDYDQTGSIAASELRRVLDNYCYVMNDEEFMKLMNTLDADHDGAISYEEFMDKIGREISFEAPLRRNSRTAQKVNSSVARIEEGGGGRGHTEARGTGGKAQRVPKQMGSQINFG